MLNCFKSLINKMGVDYDQMNKILKIKLLMDRRKTSVVFNKLGKNKEGSRYGLFVNLFISLFLGLLLVIPKFPVFYVMSILFVVIMGYLSLSMLADFSSVILDVRDRMIIGTKPVSNKTLNVTKLIHISIYLARTAFSLTLFPLVVSIFRFGITFFLIFIIEIVLVTVLIMFFTSIIYYILISVVDGEKLKDIINYIQAAFSIVLLVGQQIICSTFQLMDSTITYSFKNWFYFAPPMWMAAPFQMLENGAPYRRYMVMSFLSIGVPIILLVVYIKYMSPYFELKLMKLNSGGNVRAKKIKMSERLTRFIGDKICKEPVERATYNFINCMTSSERKFKLKLYPELTMAMVGPWVFIGIFLDIYDNPQAILGQIRETRSYFWLYICLAIGTYVLALISKSENYKAAWIYKVSPCSSPVPIVKGMVKAIMVKYSLPFTLVECALFVALYGVKIIPAILVIFLNAILFLLISFKVIKKQMPFSVDFSAKDTPQVTLDFVMLGISLIIGGIHWKLSYIPYGNAIVGIISVLAIGIIWKDLFNLTWEDIVID